MKKVSIFLSSLLLSLLLCATAVLAAEPEVIKVRDAVQLVRAIGPNRVINLAPGTYNLTEAAGISNPYVSWEDCFDGPQLNISNVSGLTINGGSDRYLYHLVVSPSYADVMQFANCSDIKLNGLKMGHLKTGTCTGSVLDFSASERIEISRCELYGCGVIGLELNSCKKVKVSSSKIHSCSDTLLSLVNSSQLSFENVNLQHRDNAYGAAVHISGILTDVAFKNSFFSGYPHQSMFSGYQPRFNNFTITNCKTTLISFGGKPMTRQIDFSYSSDSDKCQPYSIINRGFDNQDTSSCHCR